MYVDGRLPAWWMTCFLLLLYVLLPFGLPSDFRHENTMLWNTPSSSCLVESRGRTLHTTHYVSFPHLQVSSHPLLSNHRRSCHTTNRLPSVLEEPLFTPYPPGINAVAVHIFANKIIIVSRAKHLLPDTDAAQFVVFTPLTPRKSWSPQRSATRWPCGCSGLPI